MILCHLKANMRLPSC